MKKLITLLIAICSATILFGQYNNLKRTVLFTLWDDEEIDYYEYFVSQHLNQNRFACVTYGNGRRSFVFNGKRIQTSAADNWHGLHYLNLDEENGYIVSFLVDDDDKNEYYVNNRGKEEGPFDDVCRLDYDDYYTKFSTRNCDYYYKLNDRWYGNKDGKNKKVEFIEKIYDYDQYYLSINGNIVTSDDGYYSDFILSKDGKYAYSFYNRDDAEWWLNINGNTIGPYQRYSSISQIALTEDEDYAYVYAEGGKDYVCVNGKTVSRGCYNIYHLTLTENGKYAYIFDYDYERWVNINGKIYPDSAISIKTKNNEIFYAYFAVDGKKRLKDENGRDANVKFPNTTGFLWEIEGHHNWENIEFYSKNKRNSFFSNYQYNYVTIDGCRYGSSPALSGW
jgi:hypothetical protein